MDWRTIIKEKRELNPNRHNRAPERRKPQTKLVGGKSRGSPSPAGNPFDETDEDRNERMLLANATREDLMDKVMDMIGSMSEDDLIDLLMTSQGEVEVREIGVTNRRG